MKKIFSVTLGIAMAAQILAQNYIPLKIDSSYYWSWRVSFEGDTLVYESPTGYSYDSKDSLIQRRQPTSRFSYSYTNDTIRWLSEMLDKNDTWSILSRTTSAYHEGVIVTQRNEIFYNNQWENSALYSYFYDYDKRDTLKLLQHWKNGTWANFYKKVNTFDTDRNKIEEAEYYLNSMGNWDYNRGAIFKYDKGNHRIQQINIASAIQGDYFTSKTTWVYGTDDLLDTMINCNYTFGNNIDCKNISMSTYSYLGKDTIEEAFNGWVDNIWKYYGKWLTFRGPEVYSNKADSMIYYSYRVDSLDHIPTVRRYYQYKDLGNDKIYFRVREYTYFLENHEWRLTDLEEEWYHKKAIVDIQNMPETDGGFSIFPSPCKTGGILTVQNKQDKSQVFSILVFDLQGRLVSERNLTHESQFIAPNQSGTYLIVIRDHDKIGGIFKQVITD